MFVSRRTLECTLNSNRKRHAKTGACWCDFAKGLLNAIYSPRIRFSLRLFLLTTLSTGVLFGVWIARALEQQHAVDVLSRFGKVIYEGNSSDEMDSIRLVPKFLEELLGANFFVNVVEGRFRRLCNDDCVFVLGKLNGLKHLKYVDFVQSDLRDFDVEKLTQNQSITWLRLDGNVALTDEAVRRVASRLVRIEELFLMHTNITDESLVILAGCDRLFRLHLACTKVTDWGIHALSKCRSLEHLDLTKTSITSRGIISLLSFDKLTHVNLSYTEIDEPTFLELSKMQHLKEICIKGTAITTDAINNFRTRNPTVKILH